VEEKDIQHLSFSPSPNHSATFTTTVDPTSNLISKFGRSKDHTKVLGELESYIERNSKFQQPEMPEPSMVKMFPIVSCIGRHHHPKPKRERPASVQFDASKRKQQIQELIARQH